MPKHFTSSAEEPTRKVLTIRHKKTGAGPFVGSDDPAVDKIMGGTGLPSPQTSRGWTDEDIEHLENPNSPTKKFGFSDEKMMRQSISDKQLTALKTHGYELQWVDADHIWHGDGKQVFYSTPKATADHQERKKALEQKTKAKGKEDFSAEEIAAMEDKYNIKKKLIELQETLEKAKDSKAFKDALKRVREQGFKRRRAGHTVVVDPKTKKEHTDKKAEKEMERKLRADKTYRDAALQSNKQARQQARDTKAKEIRQGRNYDRAVRDESKDIIETVGTKKRSDKYISQMSRRKEAGVKKLIDKQKKFGKTLKERLEELKKAMKQGGLGGPGSIKAGAVLPSINKLPKPGNNSLASKIGIPSVGQASKKNPIKSAEQTQNKDIKDLKMKEAQAAMKAKAPEMVKFEKNGQWSFEKSGYKGYSAEDNARRKAKNLTTETDVKAMPRVKPYAKVGNVSAAKQAAKDKAKSKKMPVKVMTGDQVPQELRDKYEKKGKS